MVANEGPARGSAAATVNLRRRRMGPSGGGAANGGANTMLQFYTGDSSSLKISPYVVCAMSIGFIFIVAFLHGVGKFYHGRS